MARTQVGRTHRPQEPDRDAGLLARRRVFTRRERVAQHPRFRTFPVETGYELFRWRTSRNWTLYRAGLWWGCSPKTWYEWEFKARLPQPVMHRIAELTFMERQCERLGIRAAMTPDAPHISGLRRAPATPDQERRRAEWRRQQRQCRQDRRLFPTATAEERAARRRQRRADTLLARYGSKVTPFQRFVEGLAGRFPKLSDDPCPLRHAARLWWALTDEERRAFRRSDSSLIESSRSLDRRTG